MAIETEIKLRASRETLAALRQSPLFNPSRQQLWRTHELNNTYFDTPDFALARARVALRIRQDGQQLIQTLKTKGASVAGLSARNEWDWSISEARLDLSLLTGECWPQQLQELDKNSLAGIFTTNFTRQATELQLHNAGLAYSLEVALDLGTAATATGASEEICELELELRQGQPWQLLALALQLAQQYPLMPCDISKAERGYRLLQPDSFDLQVQPALLQADSSMDEAIGSLAAQLLSASQRLAEQYRHSGRWKLLERWIQSLVDLRALLSSPGQIIPRRSSSKIRTLLDELLADWYPVYQGGMQQQVREQAVEQFARELEQTRWGCLSLEFALWLQQGSWKNQRSARAERQAGAALERWLQRYLREQLEKIPLQKPTAGLLQEQQPRIERTLFWLEYARDVLAPGQLDELFGELRKLYQIMLLSQDVEQLSRQAARVWQNAALQQLLKG